MRVLANIQVFLRPKGCRTHVIDEYIWARHPFLAEWQQPAHQKIPDIPASFRDDHTAV